MVISGPASSLNPMALGGAFSGEGGRREGKREWSDTAGLLVSRVTCSRKEIDRNGLFVGCLLSLLIFVALHFM